MCETEKEPSTSDILNGFFYFQRVSVNGGAWTKVFTSKKTLGAPRHCACLCVSVDLFEIREIRPGRNSKDFDRFKDAKDKTDENACFTVFYGSQFVLNTLSLGGEACLCVSFLERNQFQAML